jgi:Ca-activated chloride channel homolog
MKKVILVFCCFASLSLCAIDFNPLSYFKKYKAIKAYGQQDFHASQQLFEEVIAKDHTDYETLYNLGKVSYAQKAFDKAAEFFSSVAQLPDLIDQQKIEANFDLGNAQVQLNKLTEALQSYEHVLKLDPEHEFAQKMIEKIKKILEEQQQQEQDKQKQDEQQKSDQQEQQGQQKSKEDQPQDNQQGEQEQQQDGERDNQQPSDDQNKQSNNESSGDDNKETENKQNGDQENDQDGSDLKNQNNDQQEQDSSSNDNMNDNSKSNEQQQGGTGESEQQDNQCSDFNNQQREREERDYGGDSKKEEHQDQSERERGNDVEQQLNGQQAQDNTDQQKNHESSITEPSIDNMHGEQKEQAMSAQTVQSDDRKDDPLDERDVLLLKLLEEQDAQALKRLLKGTIKQEMPEQHGQKNW